MKNIPESYVCYIWQHELYNKNKLLTTDGEPIEIISPGVRNTDAGPDFFNAKIKINNILWVGNIEIHVNSSAWNLHSHNIDDNYDTIILHVVLENDQPVIRKNGKPIPTIELDIDDSIFLCIDELMRETKSAPCAKYLPSIEPIFINLWLQSVVIERLEKKTERIRMFLAETKNSWEDAFYIHFMRNLGLTSNAQPFEMLARSLPLKYLLKHRNNILQIEALLFGQAGFLTDETCNDHYFIALQKEYIFLQNKFSLRPIALHLWKFMRMRPAGFPTLRLAQFAQIISKHQNFFSDFIKTQSLSEFKKFFEISISDYWKTHYLFDKTTPSSDKKIGTDFISTLAINTLVPFLFEYGKFKNREDLKERAISLLEEIHAENNSIIRNWQSMGIIVSYAMQSQALIQLRNEYCNKKRCLECGIGLEVMKTKTLFV
ncbi:MAG: hypothetical protein A2275_11410 [Bacteroidetes bacterium RIFOXYA12_FULL_35_11]|nr:MAG: hypothetical protein A2X01_14385 [Bacteroidetes bacterium GWF2_35_48]OFY73468.1 MAG: hypothetical protein A2275_11410 [Bacteroidetes bacterium RIFOXYA12_FULL_35_11]OFY93176.1 MAG: hypothetical protein A2491_14515 [Bacteroidetes bacterium RIFOXYC12_FULL_35_7]OFY95518.1 MAG: hypothetical protein A2309_11075 [Bacteroidetes bacterium RIFOXYB2_FULL_35_7]HBX52288.1 DUF2851 domain-containing protein [Bacteroidales bacterium]